MTALEGDQLISKPYQGLLLQHNFLDELCMRSQDFSMTTPPNNQPQNTVSQDQALFIVTPIYEKNQKLIRLTFERGKKLIKDLMSPEAKVACGMDKLTDTQWANLSSFLDPDKVVAPGDQPH
jgi:hypothetical protein